jgi:hypothetical protein
VEKNAEKNAEKQVEKSAEKSAEKQVENRAEKSADWEEKLALFVDQYVPMAKKRLFTDMRQGGGAENWNYGGDAEDAPVERRKRVQLDEEKLIDEPMWVADDNYDRDAEKTSRRKQARIPTPKDDDEDEEL